MIYFTIWLSLISIGMMDRIYCIPSKNLSKTLNYLLLTISVFLVFFAGTRVGIGYDYDQYYILFNDYEFEERALYGIEPGFNFLVTLLSPLGSNFQFLFFAIFAVGIKCQLFIKYSPYPFLALALYFNQDFLARDMGNLRQGVAISIGLYVFLNGQLWTLRRAFLVILTALIFHFTAIIIYIYLFLRNFKFNDFILIIAVISCLIVGQLLPTSSLTSLVELINNEYVLHKLADYTNQKDYSSELGLTFGLGLRLAIFFSYMYCFKNSNVGSLHNTIKNLSWFGLCIFLLFNSFEIIAVRMALYFRILDVIMITQLLTKLQMGPSRIIGYLLISAYSLQGLMKELLRHGIYFDYKSWLL